MIEEGGQIKVGSPNVLLIDGVDTIAYEVTEEEFVAGSAESLVADYLSGEGGLADVAVYAELDDLIPGDGLDVFFNAHVLWNELDISVDERAILMPIRGFGVTTTASDELIRTEALLLVDY